MSDVNTGTLTRAFGYQGDNMNLPVADVDAALPFYEKVLGFRLISRDNAPQKAALVARDEIQMRLVENGGDPTQDGCAFHVTGIDALLAEFQRNGLKKEGSAFTKEQRNGAEWKVFFVVAPDGLCYWFGERQAD